MEVKLTKPQRDFFTSDSRVTGVISGFGAGKSEVAMFRLITTMIQYPEANMLYAAPTVPLIRDIFYPKLASFLPKLGISYKINKSENIVHLQGLGKIFCRSMDVTERLVGFEVVDAFLDELDILNVTKGLEVYRKVKARLRQQVTFNNKRKKNQLFISSTPEGFKTCYEILKKNPPPDTRLIRMSTYSNPYLPEGYIEDLLNSYPPELIQAYLNGEFVNLTSKPVWSSYNADYNDTPANLQPIPKGDILHIGLDFNVGRGCATVLIERTLPPNHPSNNYNNRPQNILIVTNEVVDTFDTPETIETLNEMFPPSLYPKRIAYPDASGTNRKSVNATTSDITLVKKAGFRVKKPNRNPPIKDRVVATNAMFYNSYHQTHLYVNKAHCPVLSERLTQQVYNQNGLPEKGAGKGDDSTDALSYPVSYMHPIKRQRMFQTNLGGV